MNKQENLIMGILALFVVFAFFGEYYIGSSDMEISFIMDNNTKDAVVSLNNTFEAMCPENYHIVEYEERYCNFKVSYKGGSFQTLRKCNENFTMPIVTDKETIHIVNIVLEKKDIFEDYLTIQENNIVK